MQKSEQQYKDLRLGVLVFFRKNIETGILRGMIGGEGRRSEES